MIPIYRQAEFVDRNNFAFFLNSHGLTGLAVEIGTHRGEWASLFLSNWQGKRLYGIDPWSVPPGYEYQASILPDTEGRAQDYVVAMKALGHHGNRFCPIQATSYHASKHFADQSVDFVYIDGDHRKEMVDEDLRLWWPKIKPSGVLGGHDWMSHGEYDWNKDVQPAVAEFASAHGLDVWLVIELLCLPWSFYMIKE